MEDDDEDEGQAKARKSERNVVEVYDLGNLTLDSNLAKEEVQHEEPMVDS